MKTATITNLEVFLPPLRSALLCVAMLVLQLPLLADDDLEDNFADRQVFQTSAGLLTGNNANASIEAGEPRHGGKRSSHSLWLTWTAPTNGLVTLSTGGSSVDTLLGIYRLDPGTAPPLERLRLIAGNDDARTNLFSVVQFAARAGEQYEIAVDGYSDATGDIQLEWSLEEYPKMLPRILGISPDRSVQAGETISLSIDTEAVPGLHLNWVFNDLEFDDEEDTTFVITNFHATNAGMYRVELDANNGMQAVEFQSEPIEVQINSEGVTSALARNKPGDALASPLVASSAGGMLRTAVAPLTGGIVAASSGVTRGFNGTQIFDTVYASRDPLEPNHCGVVGGASYWLAYVPPASGRVRLNTDGSNYDTILAVYAFDGVFTNYTNLIPVACDNNSGSNGLTSRLEFSGTGNRTYFVVVDGVNGARGLAHLNYQLDTNSVASSPPSWIAAPTSTRARLDSSVAFRAEVSGTPPLTYRWFKNSAALPGATAASLTLAAVAVEDAGRYSVEVANVAGRISSPPASLAIWSEPTLIRTGTPPVMLLRFAAAGDISFQVERASSLVTQDWATVPEPVRPVDGWVEQPVAQDTNAAGFFRVRFDPANSPNAASLRQAATIDAASAATPTTAQATSGTFSSVVAARSLATGSASAGSGATTTSLRKPVAPPPLPPLAKPWPRPVDSSDDDSEEADD